MQLDTIHVLLVEDSEIDAELTLAALADSDLRFTFERIDTREAFAEALHRGGDLILSDYMLPAFDGITALQMARDARPETPFIFVSGALGEELAIETLKSGATDYVLKQGLGRLVPSVKRALREAGEHRRFRKAEADLHASESLQRTLIEAVPGVVFTNRPDGSVEFINPMWTTYTGQSIEYALTGRWVDAVHADDRDRVTAWWQGCIASGRPIDISYRVGGRDIPYRWILVRSVPMRDEAGQIVKWVGTATDIDAQKQAEVQAETANRMKDEFLATLSHELRTPLNAIVGWTQLLIADTTDDELRQGLETIERNAQVQTQLVEDLLDVSRIISGKLTLKLKTIQLSKVICAAADAVRPAADGKGVKLHIKASDGVPRLTGDPDRLQQVVWNLLSNAIKFTPRGGVVTVDAARVDSHLELTVTDTGQGIEPNFLPHVFERFRQADGSTSRRHTGLGLGLAIVRHLVEQHGGTVSAQSDGFNRGSTFTVRLPLLAVEAEVEAIDGGGQAAGTQSWSDGLKGVKVLVVDDEPDARGLVAAVLRKHCAQVVAVGSAAEALDVLMLQKPDVLLSDIGMPIEDGYTLIRKVRQLKPAEGGAIPAAAITAFARPEDRQRVVAAGFQVYLSKPVNTQDLLSHVYTLAGRTRVTANT